MSFFLYDVDIDGHTSIDEIKDVMTTLGIRDVKDDQLRDMVDLIDTNRNGTIEFAEYVKFLGFEFDDAETSDELLHKTFQMFDKNGKGYIDKPDMQRAYKLLGKTYTQKDINTWFEEADLDKDGVINFMEFVAIMLAGRYE